MSLPPTLPRIIVALKYQISHFILIFIDDLDIAAICHFTTGIKQSELHSELEFDHNDCRKSDKAGIILHFKALSAQTKFSLLRL